MKRIIVAGGAGFFGSEIARLLRIERLDPIPLSRRNGLDIENRASIEARVNEGDLLIDAAGPFQKRSMTLVQAAIDIGFDLIDISDSAEYARGMMDLAPNIESTGIRVLTSCSSVSTVSSAAVVRSGIESPKSVTTILAPASRYTANRATIASLVDSLRRTPPEKKMFTLPKPIGFVTAFRLRSADDVILPSIWPTIESVRFYVAPNVVGGSALLGVAKHFAPLGLVPLARLLGSRLGCYAVEVSDATRTHALALSGKDQSHLIAVLPAVLAATAIARGEFNERGLVPATRHVDPERLFAALAKRALLPQLIPPIAIVDSGDLG